MLHSVVPHVAKVERYFSGLGGTQSVKRCNLTVENLEALSKYAYHLYQMDCAAGKSTHRKHAHMHTLSHTGIDTNLTNKLATTFTWMPPLRLAVDESDEDYLAGPESITDKELVEAFKRVNSTMSVVIDPDLDLPDSDGNEVLEDMVYSWAELKLVEKGTKPAAFEEDITIINKSAAPGSTTRIYCCRRAYTSLIA